MINTYEMSMTELHHEAKKIRESFDFENLTYKEKIELNKRLKQLFCFYSKLLLCFSI